LFTPEDFWRQQIDGNALHTQRSQCGAREPTATNKQGGGEDFLVGQLI